MKQVIHVIFGAAVGLGAAASAPQALAGDQAMQAGALTRSLSVAYGDLDLTKADAVNTLYARLRGAAASVCGPREDGRNLDAHSDWKRCYNAALDQAVQMVAHVSLSEVHYARTGRSVDSGQQVAGTH